MSEADIAAPSSAASRGRYERVRSDYEVALVELADVVAAGSLSPEIDPAKLRLVIEQQVEQLSELTGTLRTIAETLHAMGPISDLISRELAHGTLKAELRTRPRVGIARWLHLAIAAAARWELKALDQLLADDLAVATQAPVLFDRILWLRQSLAQGQWGPAITALSAFADDRLADVVGFEIPERCDVFIALAQLSLADGDTSGADDWLESAAQLDAESATLELARARRARVAGRHDAAASHLRRARELSGQTIAVAIEATHQYASEQTNAEMSWKACADFADAQAWLVDELTDNWADVDRLVEPVARPLLTSLASRAAAEGRYEFAREAVERADAAEGSDQPRARAELAELKARLAEFEDGSTEEVASRLTTAATEWMYANEINRALLLLERARLLTPTNPDVLLTLADALQVRAWGDVSDNRRGIEDVVPDVDRALSLTRTVLEGPGAPQSSAWGFSVQSSIEELCATKRGPESWAYSWESLRTAAMGVVHLPLDGLRWARLASAADDIGLGNVALAAASVGHAQARDDEARKRNVIQRLRTLASIGRSEEAVRLLPYVDDPREREYYRAAIDVIVGRGGPALDFLIAEARRDTLFDWGWLLMLQSMFVTGHEELATFAQRGLDLAGYRDAELSWTMVAALACLGQRKPTLAQQYSSPVDRDLRARGRECGWTWHGAALLLDGRSEGIEVMKNALAWTPSLSEAWMWQTLTRPAVLGCARLVDRDVPDLAGVDDAASNRAATLQARANPHDELSRFELRGSDPEAATRTCELLDAIVSLTEGDDTNLKDQLRDGRLNVLGEEGAVSSSWETAGPKLRASSLAASIHGLERPAVSAVVREMVELDFYDTDVYLANAGLDSTEQSVVVDELTELAQHADVGDRAGFVLQFLPWTSKPPDETSDPELPPDWRVELPSDAFDGDPPRPNQSTREIVALLEATRSLPRVDLVRHSGGEYAIARDGHVVDRVSGSADVRWMPVSAAALAEPSKLDRDAAVAGWAPVIPPATDDPLGACLTATTVEVILRITAQRETVGDVRMAINSAYRAVQGWIGRVAQNIRGERSDSS